MTVPKETSLSVVKDPGTRAREGEHAASALVEWEDHDYSAQ